MTAKQDKPSKKGVKKYRICVVGAGHVGLVAAACFSDLGHKVICVDSDKKRLQGLRKNTLPFYEPDLEPLVGKNQRRGNLQFLSSLAQGVKKSEVIFIAVGTPPQKDGSADLSSVETVARTIAQNLNSYKLVVGKSTVPVQTGRKIKETIYRYRKISSDFDVASNPEFLREGKAICDFFHPDRIVIGVESERAEGILKDIYAAIEAPVIATDINTSELIKHASNSFLATKISFINAVSRVCDLAGANVEKVAEAMGLDRRIGKEFLQAGLGYGGFCLNRGERVIVKDSEDRILIISVEELFEKYSPGKLEVLSFNLNTRKVDFRSLSLMSRREYKGKMIEFKTAMNRRIVVTADHPMIVSKNGELVTICADQIKENDRFPLFTDIPSLDKTINIDLFSLIQDKELLASIKVRPLNSDFRNIPSRAFKLLKERKRYPSWRIHDFKRKNYLMMKDYLFLEKNGLLDGFSREELLLFTTKGRPTYIRAKFDLDRRVLKLLGYYLSEGHITAEQTERGRRERIVFTFNEKEGSYIKEVTSALEYLHIRYSLRNIKQDRALRITTSSRIFAYLLKNILKCGGNSYDASIPFHIFSLPKDDKLTFLSSIHRGDGYVYFPSYTPSVSYEYGTVSKDLKDGLVVLFHSLGIVPHLRTFRSAKSKALAYGIRVSGHDQIKLLPLFKDEKVQEKIDLRLQSFKRYIRPTGYRRISKDFCTVKVKKINSYYSDENVYSLEVKDTNTFITSEGIVVHNCFPKDIEAFTYISKKLGYNFDLLKEVRKINDEQRHCFVEKVKEHLWVLKDKKIAVLGLSFKPDTDDMRFAPAIDIVDSFLKPGSLRSPG